MHVEQPFNCVEEDVDLVYFFVNDICPELIKKLAWAKAKEMEKIFIADSILPTAENATKTSLYSSPYYTQLNHKMGYRAMSNFLDGNATKAVGSFYKELNQEIQHLDKDSQDRRTISNKYFDEVLVNTIDNRFLDLKAKQLHGILSKSYRLFPIHETLSQRLKAFENQQKISNKVKQPWEKSNQ